MANPTELQIHDLYSAGEIRHATWCNALRALRGERAELCEHSLQTCRDILSGKRPDDLTGP